MIPAILAHVLGLSEDSLPLPILNRSRLLNSVMVLLVLVEIVFHIWLTRHFWVSFSSEAESGGNIKAYCLITVQWILVWYAYYAPRIINRLPRSSIQSNVFGIIPLDGFGAPVWGGDRDEIVKLAQEGNFFDTLSESELLTIAFGPFAMNPEEVQKAMDQSLEDKVLNLARTHRINPFVTMDRLRLAAWICHRYNLVLKTETTQSSK